MDLLQQRVHHRLGRRISRGRPVFREMIRHKRQTARNRAHSDELRILRLLQQRRHGLEEDKHARDVDLEVLLEILDRRVIQRGQPLGARVGDDDVEFLDAVLAL